MASCLALMARPMPDQPAPLAANVLALLHAAVDRLALEEQQALTLLLETAARNPRCGHLVVLCPDGLGCFACLAAAGELP
jgi:hypothetical protein